jgi:mono/diheme cytochrome c family protein
MKYLPLILAILLQACAPASHDPSETPERRDQRELSGFLAKPETVDYAAVKKHVFEATCLKCHSLNGSNPDRDAIAYSANMTSYQTLFNAFTPVIVKGNPEESALYRAIAIKQSMPPASKGYHPLKEEQVELLRLWILNCAPETAAQAATSSCV